MNGDELYRLAERIYPIRRSLTGAGVRQTLRVLKERLPGLEIHEVPSGSRAMDWIVPPEWNVAAAYVDDEYGNRVVDWADNALHLVGYSEPVDAVMEFEELDAHLHSLPQMPDGIPYVTSYYARGWGFCMRHSDRQALDKGARYHVVIESALDPHGSLTYADLVVPGDRDDEVLLSTYVCHPPMGNNETSGPVVTAALAAWVSERPRRLTYRFVFVPETIGALVYLSQHLSHLKRHTVAGFVVTCVGDDWGYTHLPSRNGHTLADRVAVEALEECAWSQWCARRWLDRGSDERQYCAPGVDLPVCSIMRTKYGDYEEYHTSLDDLSFISPEGLWGAFCVYRRALEILEQNRTVRMTCLGEPQLGRRGLYPNVSTRTSAQEVQQMMDVISYLDGTRDLLDISQQERIPFDDCARVADLMIKHGLAEEVRSGR